MTLHIEPAYGRDYKSKAEVIQSWANGSDFRITSMGPDCGRYVNSSDYPKGEIQVRYSAQRKVCIIDATAKPPERKAPIELALGAEQPRKRGELRPGDRVKVKPRLAPINGTRGPWTVATVGERFVEVIDSTWPLGVTRTMARGGLVRVAS